MNPHQNMADVFIMTAPLDAYNEKAISVCRAKPKAKYKYL